MGLSPRLPVKLFYPFVRLCALGLIGFYLALGAYRVSQDGWREGNGWSGGATMMFAAVFCGLVLSLLMAQWRRFRRELEDADGEFYEYEGQRLRVVFDAQDALWLSARDLAAALGKAPNEVSRMLLGFTSEEMQTDEREPWLSEAGVIRLLSRRSGRDIAKLERFLIGEIFATHAKRRAAGKLHYQPHAFSFNDRRPQDWRNSDR